MELSKVANRALTWLTETTLNPISLLPYVPLLLISYYLLSNLLSTVINLQTSDLSRIPEPYTPPHKRYTVGHNILWHIMFGGPITTAKMYNTWRREHGQIFQLRSILGERNVFLMSERAIREMNITKCASFHKPQSTKLAVGSLIGARGIILAEGEDHARLRRIVGPAMHHEALMTLGDVFLEQGRLLADRYASMGPTGDVLREVRLSTYAVIFETCFGKNAISKEEYERIREAYLTVFLEPPARALARVVLTKFFWFLGPTPFQYRADLKSFLRKAVLDLCRQNSRGGDRATLLQMMVDVDSDKALDNEEMLETALSFLVGGQVTTSISVCWLLYLLARYPEWQERLVEEMGGWSEDDGLAALDELPLLSRVVREAIRLYPPVFSVARVTIEPVVIDGYKLPTGTSVRLPILALQRSEDVWGSDANEFNPNRFLKDGELARTRMFWCAFLFGQRGCIGQRYALLEIKAFVAQILVRQRVYVKPLQDPPPGISGPLCTPKDMKLYFEARKGS